MVLDLKEVDKSDGSRNIKKLVQGDCGNRRFAFVATRTSEPSLLREAALETLGFNGAAAMGEHAPTVDLGGLLWRHGWRVAMVHCGNNDSTASGSSAELAATPADGPWAMPPSNEHKPMYGVVEVLNTRLTDARMAAAYPLSVGPVTPPPLPPPLRSTLEGVTVVVMTFQSSAKANRAKHLLSQLTSLNAYATPGGRPLIAEGVLLWNGAGENQRGASWSPPSDFLVGLPRCRLVLAPVNDLQNRMNMALVKPATQAVLVLDDDNALPSAAALAMAYSLWRTHGGARLVGLLDSRLAPISIATATVGSVAVCGAGNFAYLGQHHCRDGNAWLVEPPFLFHQARACRFIC
jgi:hypothetical protein